MPQPDISKKINDGNKKRKKQKPKNNDKNEKNTFFNNFKHSMIDDFKGTIKILLVFGGLCLALKTIHPISVVVSGSMEPVLFRGDLIIATGWKYPNYEIGDIIMWRLGTSPIVVHRIIKINETRFLTKGDNNNADDIGLYRLYGHPNPPSGLGLENIQSKVLVHFPKVGYPIMLAKENMIITVFVSLGLDYLWTTFWKKKKMSLGEMAYNVASTLAVLFIAKRMAF
ncbi:MAG: hypothetical protein EZS28_001650 [Streblomastix strix]|uniref:Signal peptidase complex catalytic subunit SEC11 n=1 Tax=Streblomastix strix TaxID=222440 RepID=A0A5J4X7J2_9EUKA|nr:MAG: hypothetical protein EZS28_001650 [Streblomastix strix]